MSAWKTMDEAPRTGKRVLAWHPLWSDPLTVQFYGDWWGIDYTLGALKHQPTHFMDLPPPPLPGESNARFIAGPRDSHASMETQDQSAKTLPKGYVAK